MSCIHIIAHGKGLFASATPIGVDSSRVLEEIMGAKSRTAASGSSSTPRLKFHEAIGNQQFDRSREMLIELRGADRRVEDPEVTRLHTLLDFLEGRE